MSKTARNQWRNQRVGLVFQFHNLLPELNALDNVMVPSWLGKQKDEQAEARAKELLERLGVGHRLHHYPSELSGGEQQRVAIARALYNKSSDLILDEATSSLDTKTERNFLKFISKLKEFKLKIIVTHRKTSLSICNEIFDMKLVKKNYLR